MPTYREERTILADEYVAPKTSNLKWGQEFPEGKYFSNNLSGCGPTALAIGLAYLKYPPQIVITRNGPKELYPLNWEDICKHTQSYSMVEHELGLDCRNCTEARHESIAILCRQIATNANATSDTLGTSVNRYNLGNAAISLLSSNHVPDNFKSISASGIRSACNSGIALFRGGVDDSNFGHIWVVDGYKYTSTLVRVYEVDNNVISLDGSNEELIDEYREIKFTVSCNWGWNGRYNGYFNSEVMNIPVGKFTPTDILTIKD